MQHIFAIAFGKPTRHVLHAVIFESPGIGRTSGHEVIAHRDAVAVFFGGPAAKPGSPGAVGRKFATDCAVVFGQVIFCQKVDDECFSGDCAKGRL